MSSIKDSKKVQDLCDILIIILFDSVKLSVYLSKELEANIEFKGAFKS
jgi:hypothetical protein